MQDRYLPEISEEELPDFSGMTLDEIIEWRVEQRRQMYRFKALIYKSTEEYERKVHEQTLKTRMAAVGLDSVEVTPEMVTLYSKGQKPGVDETLEEQEPSE